MKLSRLIIKKSFWSNFKNKMKNSINHRIWYPRYVLLKKQHSVDLHLNLDYNILKLSSFFDQLCIQHPEQHVFVVYIDTQPKSDYFYQFEKGRYTMTLLPGFMHKWDPNYDLDCSRCMSFY